MMLYTSMALPVLLYGSEAWTVEKEYRTRTGAAEISSYGRSRDVQFWLKSGMK
jgi:hypothetical protein